MVHHGRKTDVRELVLINSNKILRNNKARKLFFLCLSSIVLGTISLFPFAVKAQSNSVYNSSNAGQTEIRLQQMETQIRELTGKVEKQVYEINSLKQKISMLEKMSVSSNQSTQQDLSSQGMVARMGASQIGMSSGSSQLNLGSDDPKPKAMQTVNIIEANSDATAQYEQAYAHLKKQQYSDAQQGFDKFLKVHGDHILAANAKYWLGETYYVRGNYKKAARVFAEGFQQFPDSAKSPDILLKLGMSLKGMGKQKDACVALSQLPVKFPSGNEEVLKRAEHERTSLSCDM